MPFMKERLKQRRVDMGITLQEVAEIIGVEKPTVQRYESGKIVRLDTLTVEKLAEAIRCNPAYLMGWEDEPNARTTLQNVTADEKQLVTYYRTLNQEGREKSLAYLDDLQRLEKYIKNNESGVVQGKEA